MPPENAVPSGVGCLDIGVHNGAHLIIVDSEVGLLAPEIPLYNCPTLKPYKQLQTGVTRNGKYRYDIRQSIYQQYQCFM